MHVILRSQRINIKLTMKGYENLGRNHQRKSNYILYQNIRTSSITEIAEMSQKLKDFCFSFRTRNESKILRLYSNLQFTAICNLQQFAFVQEKYHRIRKE